MVSLECSLNSFFVKRISKLDFPTDASPTRTTGRGMNRSETKSGSRGSVRKVGRCGSVGCGRWEDVGGRCGGKMWGEDVGV